MQVMITAFKKHLETAPEVHGAYVGRLAPWTQLATKALVAAARAEFPDCKIAAKGVADEYGRSEYFTADVTAYVHESWAPPLFVAEHENTSWRGRLQSQAWKLLSIEARRRVLVGYWQPGRKDRVHSFDDMASAIEEVARQIPRRDILILAAPFHEKPADAAAVPRLFESRIIGHW